MKRIGFLSFGHWGDVPGSLVRSAGDSLLQGIDLAVAAEEVGIDGAFFRVHHFAEQQASPFPLLAAVAARTSRIEIGTGVIDMRYENPLYMAEEAAAVDLISAGRLQLGVSRGSPESVVAGYRAFGHLPAEGESDADMARRHTALFRSAISGAGIAGANPQVSGRTGLVPVQPLSPSLPERVWWGAGNRASARWAGQEGMNLMSSTLLTEDTGIPFDLQQADQIAGYRQAWADAGHPHAPRVSVSRSIVPLIDAISVSLSGSWRSCPGTRPWPLRTRCSSPSPTSWAWTSMSGCSPRFPATSGRPWAGTGTLARPSPARQGRMARGNRAAPGRARSRRHPLRRRNRQSVRQGCQQLCIHAQTPSAAWMP